MNFIKKSLMTDFLSKINWGLINKIDTPFYIYDENHIHDQCTKLKNMCQKITLQVRYAMKANSNAQILKIMQYNKVTIDASSFNQIIRAHLSGYPLDQINYCSQQIIQNSTVRSKLFEMMKNGLKYNVCSLRQYQMVREFAIQNKIILSIRVHPGEGAGESATRNTGDKYSCFGVHLEDLQGLLNKSRNDGIQFDELHIHIGSGGSEEKWEQNIIRQLQFAREYFKNLKKINFGGGLKIKRMPNEEQSILQRIGQKLQSQMLKYYQDTKTYPIAVIQPGTFLVANSGYTVTTVVDKKKTGTDGFNFVITDGGMQLNTRPLLYGSHHPFYVISRDGIIKSSQDNLKQFKEQYVVVGRCCQSGDSQSLDVQGHIIPRIMAEPDIKDYVLIGGTGAYCSSMSLINYNSHFQVEQYLVKQNSIVRIRKRQSIEQMIQNETRQIVL